MQGGVVFLPAVFFFFPFVFLPASRKSSMSMQNVSTLHSGACFSAKMPERSFYFSKNVRTPHAIACFCAEECRRSIIWRQNVRTLHVRVQLSQVSSNRNNCNERNANNKINETTNGKMLHARARFPQPSGNNIIARTQMLILTHNRM